jgi:hypothetical protein
MQVPEGQGAAAPQARQPSAVAVHVCTCVPEHCVAPAVEQPFVVHDGVTHVFTAAEHVPVGQAVAALQARQISGVAVQVCTCAPEHCVAPADEQPLLAHGVSVTHWLVAAEHVCPVGQAVAGPQARHSPACAQACTCEPLHWVAPTDGQSFLHGEGEGEGQAAQNSTAVKHATRVHVMGALLRLQAMDR